MSRLDEFSGDIARARDLVGIGQSIGAMTNGTVDSTDLYRAALVQGVAAWDRYIHGVVLDRAVGIVLGRLPPGPASRVGISVNSVANIMSATDEAARELAARSSVAERLATETYQKPDDVAKALAMVGVKSIWSTAFPDARKAKIELGVIVERRNKIVHQCDYDPLIPGSVTPLAADDAIAAVQVINHTVHAIAPHCK